MSPNSLPVRRVRPVDLLPRRRSRLGRIRVSLGDGARTTLHLASYERQAVDARVAVIEQPMPLLRWCQLQGVRNAIVGGFFVRPRCTPRGDVRVQGVVQPSVPFDAPWGGVRACVHITAARATTLA